MLEDFKIACFQILTRPDANPLNKQTLCKTNHTCSIHADNLLGNHVCTWAGRKENGRAEETTPLIVSSRYQHKGCQCAHVGWRVSSWCAAHAFLTSSQGGLLFHLLPGCTACRQIHYRQSSINYKLATTTQENILETDDIMKTEKLQREGAISKGVVFFSLFGLGFFEEAKWPVKQEGGGWWWWRNTLKEVAVEKQSCRSGQVFQEDCIPFYSYSRRKTNSETSSEGRWLELPAGLNKKVTFKYKKISCCICIRWEGINCTQATLLFKLVSLQYFLVPSGKYCSKTETSTV